MDSLTPPARLSRRAALLSAASAAFVLAAPAGRTGVAEAMAIAHAPEPPQETPRHPSRPPARPVTTFEGGTRDWDDFKRRFVTADGRVIDTGNGGCSHTEGQGVGMLFAVAFNDPATFDRLFGWTEHHLRRPFDALHGWRFQPNAPTPVADWNNATDGDLYIAAALLRAARRWNRPDYARAGTAIARDVLALLVREAGGRTVLLPGAAGFETADGVTLNPSYYIFPLLAELAEAYPSPRWEKLIADGAALIEQGRFGACQLPPDWLLVSRADGSLRPHPHWPARFSYDAIRVPLFLAWGGVTADKAGRAFCSWAASHAVQPAWVDLQTNAIAGYAASPGMTAIARVASAARAAGRGPCPVRFPAIAAAPDYYSASLVLLSRLAWQESREV